MLNNESYNLITITLPTDYSQFIQGEKTLFFQPN